ncbi:MAG TPA: type I polyketide synthase [Chitinophagales bacterium]|nr:type I polyketide synthase [Chitinophagales bacterium]HMW12112.1 type I polyketide synthase [Chitinophagales bacterium]HMX59900.1 type I polyketide synthase [Chitinophagales bacterium]HMY22727.1 type I polyketide synthase [Chitinophagales bacterium]HMZ33524.1 type I polyketide synthase [Chitinophagales bacterium]
MENIDAYQQQLSELRQQISVLQSALENEKNASNEPIAIIGMAMRLPGKIKNAKDLWRVLVNGIDCIEEIPANRWDKDALFDADPNAPGKLYVKEGGFIEDIEYLDGAFFNISPIELESTDPQQRILLEVTHEAFENAGIDVNKLVGSDTGVFIGIDNVDYEAKQIRSKDYKLISGYCYTGTGPTGASGRISYTMGLRGPCMTIDTACSSALTCTHVAIQALRNKDCKIAVVGAASIISEPDQSLNFCRLGALSPEARCKSFDDAANGYIRSEGVCAMIIKKLSDAQNDDDNILAIIKGSAINQDGKSKRLTAPSTAAQGLMHTAALKNAQLQPTDIDYIEAHGTGTKVGDPVEVRGLMLAYEKFRTKEKPLIIGAIKSNIGHMECNAGMASMFKVVLGLQHNIIPKSIHFHTPNTLIDWENIPIKVAKDNIEWKRENDKIRYAGVSGFGATGSNAHIIIGDAPKKINTTQKDELRHDVYVLPLSAKSEHALFDLAKLYATFIQESEYKLEDICAMTSLRRAHFDLRETFVATTKAELIEKLNDYAENGNYENKKKFDTKEKIKTVFIFPGQGAQWITMGKMLMQHEPVFKSALEECAQVFSYFVDWNIIDEINKAEASSRLSEIDIVQPVLVAMEIALANLWMSKGVFPDSVVGHSMGEVAAAYVAGMLTLHDAAKIICTRSKLMKQLSGKGEMGATDLTAEEANEILKAYENRLSVAVMNSKNSTVISGDPAALDEVFAKLEAQGRFNRKVKVNVASHSTQMDEIKQDLFDALQTIQPQNSTIHFYSTALNEIIEGDKLKADYWVKNLRNPVQFGNAIRAIVQQEQVAFIEMSPHALLTHAINENIQDKPAIVVASITRDKNELIEFYSNIASLEASHYPFDWKNIYPNLGAFVQLPNYAWQKERYWFDQQPEYSINTSIVKKDISKNLYNINWHEIQVAPNIEAKKILIVKDNYGIAHAVENVLRQHACIVTTIDAQDDFENIDVDIVIHVGSLYNDNPFLLNLENGILSLQKMLHQFNRSNKSPKICVVTNGAFTLLNDTAANLNSSMMTGVLRTLENEHEEINFLQIDIANELKDIDSKQLASLVFVDDVYKEIAIRKQTCYASNIEKISTLPKRSKSIKQDKTYVVVGGTSGLGLYTVNWLVQQQAKNILVLSRSGAKEEAKSIFEKYKSEGVYINDVIADVSNFASLQDAISSAPSVAGVFYAAGILDDAAFENLSKAQFESVITTKAIGAWNMHELTKNQSLDFFVLYSSAAGIVGSAGQANYNAANTFMDSLAHYRSANQLEALAVDFGTIAAIGLAARQENRADRLAEQGVTAIQPNELYAYFDTLFLSDATQIMAMEIDFSKWSNFNHAVLHNHFYSKVVQATHEEQQAESISFANIDEYKKHIKEHIKQHISTATKLLVSKIKEDETFKALGIDSLHALQLKNKLQADFNLTFNVAVVWQYPTVQKLADFIANELKLNEQFANESSDVISSTPSSAGLDDIETQVKNLSLEDLMKELSSKVD